MKAIKELMFVLEDEQNQAVLNQSERFLQDSGTVPEYKEMQEKLKQVYGDDVNRIMAGCNQWRFDYILDRLQEQVVCPEGLRLEPIESSSPAFLELQYMIRCLSGNHQKADWFKNRFQEWKPGNEDTFDKVANGLYEEHVKPYQQSLEGPRRSIYSMADGSYAGVLLRWDFLYTASGIPNGIPKEDYWNLVRQAFRAVKYRLFFSPNSRTISPMIAKHSWVDADIKPDRATHSLYLFIPHEQHIELELFIQKMGWDLTDMLEVELAYRISKYNEDILGSF